MLFFRSSSSDSQNSFSGIFSNLTQEYKLIITNADISFVVNCMHEYFQKAEKSEINETSFMSLESFVLREARKKNSPITLSAIHAILDAEALRKDGEV